MNSEGRVLPVPTVVSAPFWEGCARGELRAQRCDPCAEWVFPPLPACPRCLAPSLRWVASEGMGEVYSYSVVHRPQVPTLAVPYVVALVELAEGWRIVSNLIECPLDRVSVGLRVRVAFHDAGDVTLPFFVPASAASSRPAPNAKPQSSRSEEIP